MYFLGMEKCLLRKINPEATKKKTDRSDYIKIKNSCMAKTKTKQLQNKQRPITNWKNISAIPTEGKGLFNL